ncbi:MULTISPECIES: CYTH domain-containing protein [unclassified Paenibacillus]|uniref:CYTH domain-containing protein n=1 Tax=unclassified Paenibacillus TaxID=185978 RepID=UPI00362D74C5
MSKEIERKFLLTGFPAKELVNNTITLVSKQYIFQTYLAFSEDQEIRVRKLVNNEGVPHYTHTFKSGHGLVREEIEYSISEEVYTQLLNNTKLKPLEKIRTKVEHEGRILEVDEYKQIDLIVVEVEFPDLHEAEVFTVPSWFGRELGQEEEFRNKTLWLKLQTENL